MAKFNKNKIAKNLLTTVSALSILTAGVSTSNTAYGAVAADTYVTNGPFRLDNSVGLDLAAGGAAPVGVIENNSVIQYGAGGHTGASNGGAGGRLFRLRAFDMANAGGGQDFVVSAGDTVELGGVRGVANALSTQIAAGGTLKLIDTDDSANVLGGYTKLSRIDYAGAGTLIIKSEAAAPAPTTIISPTFTTADPRTAVLDVQSNVKIDNTTLDLPNDVLAKVGVIKIADNVKAEFLITNNGAGAAGVVGDYSVAAAAGGYAGVKENATFQITYDANGWNDLEFRVPADNPFIFGGIDNHVNFVISATGGGGAGDLTFKGIGVVPQNMGVSLNNALKSVTIIGDATDEVGFTGGGGANANVDIFAHTIKIGTTGVPNTHPAKVVFGNVGYQSGVAVNGVKELGNIIMYSDTGVIEINKSNNVASTVTANILNETIGGNGTGTIKVDGAAVHQIKGNIGAEGKAFAIVEVVNGAGGGLTLGNGINQDLALYATNLKASDAANVIKIDNGVKSYTINAQLNANADGNGQLEVNNQNTIITQSTNGASFGKLTVNQSKTLTFRKDGAAGNIVINVDEVRLSGANTNAATMKFVRGTDNMGTKLVGNIDMTMNLRVGQAGLQGAGNDLAHIEVDEVNAIITGVNLVGGGNPIRKITVKNGGSITLPHTTTFSDLNTAVLILDGATSTVKLPSEAANVLLTAGANAPFIAANNSGDGVVQFDGLGTAGLNIGVGEANKPVGTMRVLGSANPAATIKCAKAVFINNLDIGIDKDGNHVAANHPIQFDAGATIGSFNVATGVDGGAEAAATAKLVIPNIAASVVKIGGEITKDNADSTTVEGRHQKLHNNIRIDNRIALNDNGNSGKLVFQAKGDKADVTFDFLNKVIVDPLNDNKGLIGFSAVSVNANGKTKLIVKNGTFKATGNQLKQINFSGTNVGDEIVINNSTFGANAGIAITGSVKVTTSDPGSIVGVGAGDTTITGQNAVLAFAPTANVNINTGDAAGRIRFAGHVDATLLLQDKSAAGAVTFTVTNSIDPNGQFGRIQVEGTSNTDGNGDLLPTILDGGGVGIKYLGGDNPNQLRLLQVTKNSVRIQNDLSLDKTLALTLDEGTSLSFIDANGVSDGRVIVDVNDVAAGGGAITLEDNSTFELNITGKDMAHGGGKLAIKKDATFRIITDKVGADSTFRVIVDPLNAVNDGEGIVELKATNTGNLLIDGNNLGAANRLKHVTVENTGDGIIALNDPVDIKAQKITIKNGSTLEVKTKGNEILDTPAATGGVIISDAATLRIGTVNLNKQAPVVKTNSITFATDSSKLEFTTADLTHTITIAARDNKNALLADEAGKDATKGLIEIKSTGPNAITLASNAAGVESIGEAGSRFKKMIFTGTDANSKAIVDASNSLYVKEIESKMPEVTFNGKIDSGDDSSLKVYGDGSKVTFTGDTTIETIYLNDPQTAGNGTEVNFVTPALAGGVAQKVFKANIKPVAVTDATKGLVNFTTDKGTVLFDSGNSVLNFDGEIQKDAAVQIGTVEFKGTNIINLKKDNATYTAKEFKFNNGVVQVINAAKGSKFIGKLTSANVRNHRLNFLGSDSDDNPAEIIGQLNGGAGVANIMEIGVTAPGTLKLTNFNPANAVTQHIAKINLADAEAVLRVGHNVNINADSNPGELTTEIEVSDGATIIFEGTAQFKASAIGAGGGAVVPKVDITIDKNNNSTDTATKVAKLTGQIDAFGVISLLGSGTLDIAKAGANNITKIDQVLLTSANVGNLTISDSMTITKGAGKTNLLIGQPTASGGNPLNKFTIAGAGKTITLGTDVSICGNSITGAGDSIIKTNGNNKLDAGSITSIATVEATAGTLEINAPNINITTIKLKNNTTLTFGSNVNEVNTNIIPNNAIVVAPNTISIGKVVFKNANKVSVSGNIGFDANNKINDLELNGASVEFSNQAKINITNLSLTAGNPLTLSGKQLNLQSIGKITAEKANHTIQISGNQKFQSNITLADNGGLTLQLSGDSAYLTIDATSITSLDGAVLSTTENNSGVIELKKGAANFSFDDVGSNGARFEKFIVEGTGTNIAGTVTANSIYSNNIEIKNVDLRVASCISASNVGFKSTDTKFSILADDIDLSNTTFKSVGGPSNGVLSISNKDIKLGAIGGANNEKLAKFEATSTTGGNLTFNGDVFADTINIAKYTVSLPKSSTLFSGNTTFSGSTIDLGNKQLTVQNGQIIADSITVNTTINSENDLGRINIGTNNNDKVTINGKVTINVTDNVLPARNSQSYTFANVKADGDVTKDQFNLNLNRLFVDWTVDVINGKVIITQTNKGEKGIKDIADGTVVATLSDNNFGALANADGNTQARQWFADVNKANKDQAKKIFEASIAGPNSSASNNQLGLVGPQNTIAGINNAASDIMSNRLTGFSLTAPQGSNSLTSIDDDSSVDYAAAEAESGVAAGDTDQERHGVWAKPFYNKSTQRKSEASTSNISDSFGTAFGFDTKPSDDSAVGGAITLVNTNLKLKGFKFGDKNKINSIIFSLYGYKEIMDELFVQGVFNVGTSNIKTLEKRFTSDDVVETAEGKYNSMSIGGEILTGYRLSVSKELTVMPMFGFGYTRINSGSYKETGTSFQNLQITNKSVQKPDVIIGLAAQTIPFTINEVDYTPEAHVYARYDLKGDNVRSDVRIDGVDGPLYVNKVKADRFRTNVGTSVSAKYNQMEYTAGYDVTVSNKSLGHQGSFKVKVHF
ncbi:MAG: autotransporter domain-containing protein [Rickettsiaceae bacterium]|nr:autotransporter domain-containing protein [Rickettsiaceae bacterium]